MTDRFEGEIGGIVPQELEEESFVCVVSGFFVKTKHLPKKASLNPNHEAWQELFDGADETYVAELLSRLVRMKARQSAKLLREHNFDETAAYGAVRARIRDSNQRRNEVNKKLRKRDRLPPLTRHHDLASTRKGTNHPVNLLLLNRDKHDVWHKLFKLATLQEILGILRGGELRKAA